MTMASDFIPLFNGKDLSGWHISKVNHHGDTQAWTVQNGILMGTQVPEGNGGILLTDKLYGNFEVSVEINPDFGCDGGLFLRSSEKGEAYQVMIDYLEGGSVGGIYGEKLEGLTQGMGSGDRSGSDWKKHWKAGDWNVLRARIEGDVPHIQVWMNNRQIVDWTDSQNRAAGGATQGMIAVQVHRSNPESKNPRWIPGGYHRFRHMFVKQL